MMAPMKPNLVWFDIPALDLERAIRFYSAVLGREIKQEVLGGVPTAMLPTADGAQQGCVVVVKDFKPSADGIMIYFESLPSNRRSKSVRCPSLKVFR